MSFGINNVDVAKNNLIGEFKPIAPKTFNGNSDNSIFEAAKPNDNKGVAVKLPVYHTDAFDILNGAKIVDDEEVAETDKTEKADKTDKADDKKEVNPTGRNEDGTANIADILDLPEEQVAEMSGEDLAKLYHDALISGLTGEFGSDELKQKFMSGNENYFFSNHIGPNALLASMVGKMSDEQLEEFLDSYKDLYPKREDSFFSSYEDMSDGLPWASYAQSAGLVDKDEMSDFLKRMSKYFTSLHSPLGDGGIKQWL